MSIVQLMTLIGGLSGGRWDGSASYLILAGGGGGGGVISGGGGAGGYRTSWGTGTDGTGGNSGGLSSLETALTLTNGTAYSITVGQGGQGGLGWNATANMRGHRGRTSSISGSDITTVTTVGGGGAKGYNYTAILEADGGSGGGGALATTGGSSHGSGTAGEGFGGGEVTVDIGGGGGGAGGAGGGATSTTSAGDGGVGLASTITGTSVSRAGGGGGGIRSNQGTDHGIGVDGGGDGGVNSVTRLSYGTVTTVAATSGRPHYGGGGAGAGYNASSATISTGGDGGSGTVILRLPRAANYSASQLASDVSSADNCTASYLNTQVYTDDTNFDSVVLLLDGSSTTDLSSASPTVTPSASGLTSGNSGGKYGQYIDFQNSGYINVALPSALGVSTEAFTVECWAYFDSTSNGGVFQLLISGSTLDGSIDDNTVSLAVAAFNNAWQVYDDTGGNAVGSVSTGAWYHVALVYDGTDLVFYVDGSALLTKSNWTANLSATGYPNIAIGGYYSTSFVMDGRIEDFRVTKGVARYTSSFTPPIAALPNRETSTSGDHVITFNVATETPHPGDATNNDGTITWTPSIGATGSTPLGPFDEHYGSVSLLMNGTSLTTDLGPGNHTLTTAGTTLSTAIADPFGGSSEVLLFDSDNDDILTPADADFAMGTGAFTIEMFIYPTNIRNWNMYFTTRDNFENNSATWGFQNDANGSLYVWGGGTYFVQSATSQVTANSWQYVAACRDASGAWTLYHDGTRVATGAANQRNFSENNAGVGTSADGSGTGQQFQGYMSHVRLTKGVARYTGTTMTVPTEPHPTQAP